MATFLENTGNGRFFVPAVGHSPEPAKSWPDSSRAWRWDATYAASCLWAASASICDWRTAIRERKRAVSRILIGKRVPEPCQDLLWVAAHHTIHERRDNHSALRTENGTAKAIEPREPAELVEPCEPRQPQCPQETDEGEHDHQQVDPVLQAISQPAVDDRHHHHEFQAQRRSRSVPR